MKVLLLLVVVVAPTAAMVCARNYCATVKCAQIENCQGKVVEKSSFCGCCSTCKRLLGEGDSCALTLLMGMPSTVMCQDGLFCEAASLICKKIIFKRQVAAGPCAQRLVEMERARLSGLPLLGQQHLQCSSDGYYAPVQCLGSVCYCVTADGSQIQGYKASIGASQNMNCQCARDQAEFRKTGLLGQTFSCTPSGNYQQYQCIGSVCYCADENGPVKGSQGVPIGEVGNLKC